VALPLAWGVERMVSTEWISECSSNATTVPTAQ
jgi:hypothetical protein